MFDQIFNDPAKRTTLLAAFFVLVLSYFTYFHTYNNPPHVFWDENYHIASAQKYMNGVFFMEQHPPLGKLLIALGEVILDRNADDTQFLGTDYGTDFPEGFSFAGYRLFSALLAWLTAPLLFFIFLLLTKNPLWSVLLSFLYIFDNAIIVHTRGAMLEGPLLFFSVAILLVFLLSLREKNNPRRLLYLAILFGVLFACAVTTKVVGLVFILLLPVILFVLYPRWKSMVIFSVLFGLSFVIVYVAVWQTHFALGKTINIALPDEGLYQSSDEYQEMLKTGKNTSLLSFPVMIRDSLKYVSHYNNGAPRLDLCKADENGSPFYFWPLGGRSISYRWETPNGDSYRYLYLQSNPVAWLSGFAGVLLGLLLLISSVILPLQKPLKNPFLLSVFLGLYVAYMLAISQIDRVMYLYHYFIPLVLSFIILGIVLVEIDQFWKWKITEYSRTIALLVFGVLIFGSFEFYRPLSYYEPITDKAFKRRAILPIWELSCVKCKKVNGLAVPSK